MSLNTAFSFNPDPIAQFTGTGAAIPYALTYAATQPIAPLLVGGARYIQVNGVNATSATTTVSTTYVLPAGAQIQVAVRATGGTITATFGTGFKPSATAAPTVGLSIIVDFTSDGTNFVESGRSAAVTF